MHVDKGRRMRPRFGIDDVSNVALLPELDGLRFVRRDVGITHAAKKVAQRVGIGMRKFDELKAIRAGGVIRCDGRARGVVGEGTHLSGSSFTFCSKIVHISRNIRAKTCLFFKLFA